MNIIDLHIHTNNSDGFFSVKEVLDMAKKMGLSIISITDHDSVQAYYDIIEKDLSFKGKIIPGVELSFAHNGRFLDILGYGIDIDVIKQWLCEVFYEGKEYENQCMVLNDMKKLYSQFGIKFDKTLQIKFGKKGEAYNLMKGSVLSYQENKTLAPEFWEEMFFKKHHTNPKSKYFVDESRISPSMKEVINIIHKAGGICSLAHSGAYGLDDNEMIELIETAVKNGVDALELKYNCHTPHHEEIIKKIADKYGLLLTGGSDFHGGNVKKQVKMGVVYGDKNIEELSLKPFLEKVGYFDNLVCKATM